MDSKEAGRKAANCLRGSRTLQERQRLQNLVFKGLVELLDSRGTRSFKGTSRPRAPLPVFRGDGKKGGQHVRLTEPGVPYPDAKDAQIPCRGLSRAPRRGLVVSRGSPHDPAAPTVAGPRTPSSPPADCLGRSPGDCAPSSPAALTTGALPGLSHVRRRGGPRSPAPAPLTWAVAASGLPRAGHRGAS